MFIKIKMKNNAKKNTDSVPYTQEHSIPPNPFNARVLALIFQTCFQLDLLD